jgi:branched-chain amino acid transport system substrate-binding protein
VADTEIRIGNVMPYTGPNWPPLASIGKTEAAYFDMINERGGINGRKVKFLSYDDSSDPGDRRPSRLRTSWPTTTRPCSCSARSARRATSPYGPYLNDRKDPAALRGVRRRRVGQPQDAFPWTMGWQPPFRAEGRVYANYIQAFYPERKIAVLWQNDRVRARPVQRALQEGLGDWARMIVADTTFDLSDRSIDAQLQLLHSLRRGNPGIFDGAPAIAALALRRMAEYRLASGVLCSTTRPPPSPTHCGRPVCRTRSGSSRPSFLKDAGRSRPGRTIPP